MELSSSYYFMVLNTLLILQCYLVFDTLTNIFIGLRITYSKNVEVVLTPPTKLINVSKVERPQLWSFSVKV